MTRIWHHYLKWEEVEAGMWRNCAKGEHDSFLQKAIEFTGNAELYGKWMLEVLNQWPISCEHNLTEVTQNRQAWIGHAAACIAINCPEYVVREAWGQLSQEQQDKANRKADLAIREFERRHEEKDCGVCSQMVFAWLREWNTG